MFNLLMFNADWASGRVSIPMARLFEYTEQYVIDAFRVDGSPLLDKLAALPCLFCEEGTREEIAWVGQINRIRASGSDLALEISFDTDVPALRNQVLYDQRSQLDMPQDFEFSRNHWAVKDVDLYRFLLRNVRPRRQRPAVFPLAEHEIVDPFLASAMMPFAGEFDGVFAAIQAGAESAGLRCRRADDIWENASIIQDVVSLIDRSKIVVCDCTGRNANVFYEAGIAHTLGREVILIAQSDNDIPFDLRHLRYVRYYNNEQGRSELAGKLAERMRAIIGH